MAKSDLGKKYEEVFKLDWKQSYPGTFVFRLKDLFDGHKDTSQNPCDFICYTGKHLYMAECKEHKGASIPLSAIPQYERLLKYKELLNVRPGVMLWLSDKDLVAWLPIEELEKLVNDGLKSVSAKLIRQHTYGFIEIPSTKKVIFMSSDYSILDTLEY